MFKFIAVTLAAMFTILQVFGDAERRPEVAQTATEGLSLAAFTDLSQPVEEPAIVPTLRISDSEAISMALAAGKGHRLTRGEAPRNFASLALTEKTEATKAVDATPSYWRVSGARVNIRRGPGTSNAVVGQVTSGMEAEVLDTRDGWMQIVTRDGSTSGWISGQFLTEQRPG